MMFSIAALSLGAGAQEPTWVREFGAAHDDWGGNLLRKTPDRVLMAGGTGGPLFGPPSPGQDVYLAWFDNTGSLIGGVQFGTGGEDPRGLAPARDGGVFVGGSTTGSFGGPNAGGWDAWVVRRDAAGGSVWVRQFGTAQDDSGLGLSADEAGGVFAAGRTFGSLGGASAGSIDVWIARYDEGGFRLWLHQFGTSALDVPVGMAPDGLGGFYLSGWTNGGLGGPLIGTIDAWLARIDSNGDPIWIKQIGTPQSDFGGGLGPDGSGGVFLAGGTEGALAGPNAGFMDAWLARYDRFGDQLSIVQFGGPAIESAGAVCPDGYGGAFACGSTTGSLGGPSAGSNDPWIAHLPGGTTVAWIDQFGSSLYDIPGPLVSAGPGTIFVAGETLGNLAPGGGGGADAWLARYDLCYPDCNADGVLTVADFGCFQTRFITADMYSDCNANGSLTVQDFGCFQTKFVVGCP